jgi:transcriptional regulator with XRE-family HTH domain
VDAGRARLLAINLRKARLAAGLSQLRLAAVTKIPRLRVVRAEQGTSVLNLDEAVRIAEALKVPLQRLITGEWRPYIGLRGIALELYQLGIRDLEVSAAHVPGAFRRAEQVIALALRGTQPEPRVVEAVPSLLARNKLRVPLTLAFADTYDPRVRTRLAWLSDITLALSQRSAFPIEVKSEAQLVRLVRAGVRATKPDSLGHPGEGPWPRLWTRWNITYAADLSTFLKRTLEVQQAYVLSEGVRGRHS